MRNYRGFLSGLLIGDLGNTAVISLALGIKTGNQTAYVVSAIFGLATAAAIGYSVRYGWALETPSYYNNESR